MVIKAQILDTSNYIFEKNKYDAIVLDPPYTSEGEKNKLINKGRFNRFNNKFTWLADYSVARICDRVMQYAYANPVWVIVFHNRPLFLSRYLIVWVKKRAGIGFNIGRNVEYINLVNYHGLKLNDISNKIEEGLVIKQPKDRSANKPAELYFELFRALKCKNVFDPFAGYANSAVAAYNLGINIDCIDKDPSLQERYSLINSMSKTKQLTLKEVVS